MPVPVLCVKCYYGSDAPSDTVSTHKGPDINPGNKLSIMRRTVTACWATFLHAAGHLFLFLNLRCSSKMYVITDSESGYGSTTQSSTSRNRSCLGRSSLFVGFPL